MSLLRTALVILSFFPCWLAGRATAVEAIEAEHVRLSWLAPERFAAGRPELLAVHFEVDPGWHVYWVNPGDSGAAPRFEFSGNAGVGPVQWPYPHRLPVAHLTNLGYEGDVAYLFEATPPADGALELAADLEWLVCQEECIPGFATLELQRPVAAQAEWRPQPLALRDGFRARLPRPGEGGGWALGPARFDGSVLELTVRGDGDQAPELYPKDGGFVSPAAPERVREADGWRYRFATAAGIAPPPSLSFVLVDGDGGHEFDGVVLAAAPAAPAAPGDAAGAPLWWLLALAFAGGVLLNLMPCVFPVLAIKLFSLVGSGDAELGRRLREGLLYSAGVLATFAALGGAFLVLRAGGAAVGWGFQLQSPAVVLCLVLLFWVMALGFLGVFEFGQALTRLGGKAGGAFATGVLAVFVAAPCTGPFMGAALGASATLPAAQAMAIFLGLGAGLAAPFLLLAAVPALASRLPRPGPWMETLRQFLAFPLFATVLWLLWVLGRLGGDGGWLLGGGAVLLLSFALWLARRRRALRWAGVALAVLVVGLGAQRAAQLQAPQQAVARQDAWQAYDAAAIAAARAAGTPVFIDYTAAWCITCQVNKAVVLDTGQIQQLFADHEVLLVRADWTRYDPAITEALAALGRSSVPVYVFYPADGGEPRMLPQILKPADIRALFRPDPLETRR